MIKAVNWPVWVKHLRALLLGTIAVAIALWGERILLDQRIQGIFPSTVLYAVAIVLFILATWGTYYRRSMLAVKPAAPDPATPTAETAAPATPRSRFQLPALNIPARYKRYETPGRWALTLLALAISFFAMQQLRANWFSPAGMFCYLLSVALLVIAWVGQKLEPWRDETSLRGAQADAEVSTDWRFDRRWEILYVVVICALALAVRVYNLDYLTWGMHGDEGEAATDAINILNGVPVSPFTTGWFSQPNVYFWSIALGMQIFGVDLFGLRISPVFFSMLSLPFFYLLVRRMFGLRAAFIGLALLSTYGVYLHYSRIQVSAITTPVFWIIGFYFLVRGLQTRRMLDFVLAGYAAFFSLFYYFGARVLPFMLAGFFIYMVLFQRHFLKRYWTHAALMIVASFVIVAPFIGYFLDNTNEINSRSSDKLIFNNPAIMRDQYGTALTVVLPGGLSFTPPDQVYYVWRQLTRTLGMFTYLHDASSFYDFTLEPVTNWLESALLVIGLAWTFWRWRDARFALLAIWFWAPVIAGGVFTIEAPYTPRVIGAFPAVTILIAVMLNKLIAEWVAFWRSLPENRVPKFVGARVGVALALLLAGGLTLRNATDYYGTWVWNYWIKDNSAQANVLLENGPSYKYYEIGYPYGLSFEHGTTRFIRQSLDIDGRDMLNTGSSLPLIDSNGKDVLFIVSGNPELAPYIPLLQTFYPEAQIVPDKYGRDGEISTLTEVHIPQEVVAQKQRATVSYTPATGEPSTLKVEAVGTAAAPPPAGAAYPVAAVWSGGLLAPAFTTYGFQLTAPPGSTLEIDGRPVLTVPDSGVAEQTVVLSRGLHRFVLNSTLADAGQTVGLQWRSGPEPWTPVSGLFLWDGPLGTLAGEVYQQIPDAVRGGLAFQLGDATTGPPVLRRNDAVIDFREPGLGLENRSPLTALWRGKFVAQNDGAYYFETWSRSDSGIWIDGQEVVLNLDAGGLSFRGNTIQLTAGEHDIEVRYNWSGGHQIMAMFVTPPNGIRTVVNGSMFGQAAGVWLPEELERVPAGNVQLTDTPSMREAERVINLSGLVEPRAIEFGPDGNLYVADGGNARIVVYDKQGNELRSFGSRGTGDGQFGRIIGLAFAPNGELWVGDHQLNRVQAFSTDGRLLRIISNVDKPISSLNGVEVGPDGFVYVANTANSDILRLAPDGSSFTSLPGTQEPLGSPDHLDQPIDMVVSPDNTLYVIDLRNRIVQLDGAGNHVREWPLAIGRFNGTAKLAWNDGLIYVSNPDTGEVAKFDPASGSGIIYNLTTLQRPLLRPTGIAFADDEIYVVDWATSFLQVFKTPQ